MRSIWTVSLLLALGGCGAITPAATDADEAVAVPTARDGGVAGAGPNAAAPAPCGAPCLNGNDEGKGGKRGCEKGSPPCEPTDQQ